MFGAWPWLTPLILIGGGALVGLIIEKLLIGQLRRLAARTRWEADDVIINSFRHMAFLWLFLAGLYAAVDSVALQPHWQVLAHKSLLVLFVLSLTYSISRMISGLVALYSLKSAGLFPSTSIFRNLSATIVYVVGLLVVLDTFGISITPILTALGVGGLAVALALQDTLSNLFAGI